MLGTILSVHLLIVEARLSIKLRQKVESDGEEVWAGRLKLVPSSGLWALKESWWGGLRGAPCDRCERVKKPLRSPGWVEWLRGQFIRKWLMWTMEISSSPWRKKGGSSFKFSWELNVGLGGFAVWCMVKMRVWWKWEWITKKSYEFSEKGGIVIWWQWNKWFILLMSNTTIPCLLSNALSRKEDIGTSCLWN